MQHGCAAPWLCCVVCCCVLCLLVCCDKVPALADFHALLAKREEAEKSIKKLFLPTAPSQRYRGKAKLVAAPRAAGSEEVG